MKIWRNEPDDMYKLRDLNETDIKQAEQFFSVKLPKEYIDILRVQNGGLIIYNAFPTTFETSWDDDSIYIDHIMGIGKKYGILENNHYLNEWDMPKGLILISGDGHSWIAFDYRNTKKNPEIVYVDNEEEKIFTLASSFKEFLSKLYLDEDKTPTGYEDLTVSKEEMEKHIKENNIENIVESIDILAQNLSTDIEWFSKKLLELSKHENNDVRVSVASSTLYLLQIGELDENQEVVKQLFMSIKADANDDVNYYAQEIKDELATK
ncbi:SMI1/KNR4 family protein [Pseudobacillus badius]|uniref:SMI1/KNR4 family protein n=1 Tax=Bacillus badius TaxID=1455 RepID=UPI0007B096DE|nr:SMI1/KNR4 family protein [Bacillus badius]KZO00481.1 hypothetical protein A4244_15680 [Bacillus badius]OCS87003.1 hypothetical protein A6M11_15695 [Bacillus badius]OVE45739.1 SMI1/KNR4 family protein [Bacillus badius]TDV96889.1 SUKH superfamily protein [Bacillus badius]